MLAACAATPPGPTPAPIAPATPSAMPITPHPTIVSASETLASTSQPTATRLGATPATSTATTASRAITPNESTATPRPSGTVPPSPTVTLDTAHISTRTPAAAARCPVVHPELGANFEVLPQASTTFTAMVWLQVGNSGYINWTSPVTVQISTLGGTPLTQTTIAGQAGCGRTSIVPFQITDLPPGVLTLKAQIDPLSQTPDVNFQDNTITFTMIVSPAGSLYLPLIRR